MILRVTFRVHSHNFGRTLPNFKLWVACDLRCAQYEFPFPLIHLEVSPKRVLRITDQSLRVSVSWFPALMSVVLWFGLRKGMYVRTYLENKPNGRQGNQEVECDKNKIKLVGYYTQTNGRNLRPHGPDEPVSNTGCERRTASTDTQWHDFGSINPRNRPEAYAENA